MSHEYLIVSRDGRNLRISEDDNPTDREISLGPPDVMGWEARNRILDDPALKAVVAAMIMQAIKHTKRLTHEDQIDAQR